MPGELSFFKITLDNLIDPLYIPVWK